MSQTQQHPLTTNQKVVQWASGQLNKQVGKGECWDLAEQALKHAGAETSVDLGPVEDDSDYVWGDEIDHVKDIEPGDILQFRDYEVTTTTETEYTFPDGSGGTEVTTETAERGHHTAIANGKLDANGVVKTFEQHVKPSGKVVQNKILYTRDVPPKETHTVVKRTNPDTKKVDTAKVTKKVTVTVSGTIWVYKPKPK
jgi:hypothetical protein